MLKIIWAVIALTLFAALVGVIAAVIRSRSQGSDQDFLSGFLVGVFGVMPFGIALFLYAAYRQMDEFSQQLQEKACTFAFVMTMLAASAGFVIASGFKVALPLWSLYLLGMAAYAAAVIRGSLAARGGRE
ncbi:hypothetical protein [Deinococcus sp.]|uniref:hypothetical protein n=1 Tax=Deinococcus sp. TaxID=47478 RepID=UPI0025CF4B68|nr:hypothetical protein [Deinococcus sp.]